MRNRISPVFAVLLILIVIGIVAQILNGSLSVIIPIALIAIVFLLYKFPPGRFGGGSARSAYHRAAVQSKKRQQARSKDDRSKRRTASFKVIDGNKPRDDNPPPYH